MISVWWFRLELSELSTSCISRKFSQLYCTPVFLGESLVFFARQYTPRPNSESQFEQVCSSCWVDKMTWAPRGNAVGSTIRLSKLTLNLQFYKLVIRLSKVGLLAFFSLFHPSVECWTTGRCEWLHHLLCIGRSLVKQLAAVTGSTLFRGIA